MTTFKISKAQERNYYALGILALVHLFAAIGLAIGIAVFVDGPVGVYDLLAVCVVVMLLPIIVFLGVKIYRAAAGKDIYGYLVITKNTLVVKRPGKKRQFFRRADCVGFTPHPWKLFFRGKRVVTLRGPGMGHDCRREMGAAIARTWWPKFHNGPVAALVLGDDGYAGFGPLEIRTNFPPGRDSAFPILAYGPSPTASGTLVFAIAWPLIAAALAMLVFSQSVEMIADAHDPQTRWNLVMAAAASVVTALVFGFVGGRAIWQVVREHISGRIFLLARRGMKIYRPGHGFASLRPAQLVDYAPETGCLRTTDAKPIRFALPLWRKGAFSRLLYTSLVYWQVESDALREKSLPGGSSIVGEAVCYSSVALGSILLTVAICFSDPNSMPFLGLDQRLTFGVVLLCGTLGVIACVLLAMYYVNSRAPISLRTTSEDGNMANSRSEG